MNRKWDLAFNGIELTGQIALTASQNKIQSFESSLIEVPLLLKIDINEKLSVLMGAKFDVYMNKYGVTENVGLNASYGIQYKPSSNSYIQLLFNYKINDVNNVFHYNYGSKSSFMLNTGIKF